MAYRKPFASDSMFITDDTTDDTNDMLDSGTEYIFSESRNENHCL